MPSLVTDGWNSGGIAGNRCGNAVKRKRGAWMEEWAVTLGVGGGFERTLRVRPATVKMLDFESLVR